MLQLKRTVGGIGLVKIIKGILVEKEEHFGILLKKNTYYRNNILYKNIAVG